MQICEHGFYQLVVNNQLLIRTRDKRAVEYYYKEAHRHYSSSESNTRYVCSIREPYTHVSSSKTSSWCYSSSKRSIRLVNTIPVQRGLRGEHSNTVESFCTPESATGGGECGDWPWPNVRFHSGKRQFTPQYIVWKKFLVDHDERHSSNTFQCSFQGCSTRLTAGSWLSCYY